MNRKIAIALISLFVFIGFKDVFTILWFYSNQIYIANTKCINIDKPELICAGKCYLSKKLGESKAEKSNNFPFRQYLDFKILPSDFSVNIIFKDEPVKKADWRFDFSLHQSDYLSRLFQPPEFLI